MLKKGERVEFDANQIKRRELQAKFTGEGPTNMVRLDHIAAKWIVNMWQKDRPRDCKLEIGELDVHVDWSGVSIAHEEVKYSDQPTLQEPKYSVKTVYRTNFINNTDSEQECVLFLNIKRKFC